MISMKNDKIIASWNKIEPSDSANERMLSAILERNRSVRNGMDKVNNMSKTKKWLIPVAACLALLVAVSIPILHNMRTRIPLSGASSGVTVRYANLSGNVYQTAGVLIPLTEEELFTYFDTAIFAGTVKELNDIVVDCNGMKSYWSLAKIEVSKVYRGDIDPGDTVSVRMDFPVIDTQPAEDMDTLAQLRVGMRGIFMPMIYDSTSTYEHNGATLALKDIADFGFADGVRFAFLETSDGLVFDRQSYKTISDAETLEEIEKYILSKVDHQENVEVEGAVVEENEAPSESVLHEDNPFVPTEADVLELRAIVLEGMSESEVFRLTDFIKAANLRFERAWFYDDIFGQLSDPENVYWTYFDKTGEIQIGWAESDGEKSAVLAYNNYDADYFITVITELKESLVSGMLDDDMDKLIDLCSKAKETHDVDYAIEMYHMLHDMDYFLLRYGLTDVGKYVSDTSTISKYYGSLSIWDSHEN